MTNQSSLRVLTHTVSDSVPIDPQKTSILNKKKEKERRGNAWCTPDKRNNVAWEFFTEMCFRLLVGLFVFPTLLILCMAMLLSSSGYTIIARQG